MAALVSETHICRSLEGIEKKEQEAGGDICEFTEAKRRYHTQVGRARETRERVALDEAYEFYKQLLSQGATENLHSLVNALKTVSTALEAAERGELEITVAEALAQNQASSF